MASPQALSVQAAAGFAHNTTSIQTALAQNTLGVGYAGAGFLILFYTGVTAVLKSLGIVNDKTKFAGASAGAITSASNCMGLPTGRDYATNMGIAIKCKPTSGCRGFLDQAVREAMSSVMPADAAQRCRGRLYISVTEAKAKYKDETKKDPGLTLGPNWRSNEQLLNAAAASSFLPLMSGGLVTTALKNDGIPAAYDGGLTNYLPVPPGVTYAITVTATVKPNFTVNPANLNSDLLQLGLIMFKDNVTGPAADTFMPLNPAVPVSVTPHPDIYPGLSGPLKVPDDKWSSFGLNVPDAATLAYIYNQGRLDAAAFVKAHKLASPSAINAALDATTIQAITKQEQAQGSKGQQQQKQPQQQQPPPQQQQKQQGPAKPGSRIAEEAGSKPRGL